MKRRALSNIVGQVAVAAIQVLVIPKYVGLVGVEAYGLFGVYLSIQAFAQLLDFGMSPAVSRQMSRAIAHPAEGANVASFMRTAELFYLGIGLVLGAALFAAAPFVGRSWIHPTSLTPADVTTGLRLIAVLTVAQWPLTFYNGALLGLQRTGTMNAIRVTAACVSAAGALVLLTRVAPTIAVLFSWQIVVGVVQVAVMATQVRRVLPATATAGRVDLSTLRASWRFGAGMTAVTMSATILTQMDRVVLARALPLGQFGYYALATVISSGLGTLVASLFATIFPSFSVLVARGDVDALRGQYRRMWSVMGALVLPLGSVFVAFSPTVLLLWTGDPLTAATAAPLVSLLTLGSVLNGLMSVPYALQLAHGRTSLPLRLNVALCLVGVPLLLVLTPRFGPVGAAAVWPLLNILYLVLGIPATARAFPEAAMSSWFVRAAVVPALSCVCVVAALRVLAPHAGGRVVMLAYVGLAWLAAAAAFTVANRDLRDIIRTTAASVKA
ncbi:MAG: oligosaccharide flippase family protein [Vicinamibacterales bacterium]